MIRRRWRSLSFFWQLYLVMALGFGSVIMFTEAVLEPAIEDSIEDWLDDDDVEWPEVLTWAVGVLFPTLALSWAVSALIMRRLRGTVKMAQRLSCGDLGARIAAGAGGDGDVFNQLAVSFNNMADSLERLLLHEKRMLADISHELRSPLTRMGVAVELLPIKRDADDFDTLTATLEGDVTQMSRLVSMLLDQGRQRLADKDSYARVDLSGLVGEMAAAFDLVAREAGKRIDTGIEPGLAVWGHPMRIRMILENILSNAMFYTPEEGRIDVRARRDGDRALVSVRDYGPGVPERHLKDIFRPFFRVDQSRARKSGGAGLGLAVARDAAVAMGGGIAAENAGPGLEVTASLPLLRTNATVSADPPDADM